MLKTTFRIDFISTLFFKFQGSALYVYNDAMFSKEDWKGIRSAGVSQKRDKEEKVGKFGIGFSSVYHFTGVEGLSLCFTCPPDCPWIMSGSRLDMMDPSLQHLTRPVRSWQLSEEEQRKKWEGWADMKAPWQRALKALGLPDVFSGEILHGTLFRLPLRSQPSDLSDKPYTPR